jgi:DNA-directed RNA polymerase subunit alpha
MTSLLYNIEILSYQKDDENKISSDIRIGPLKKGLALTLGNALRRSLLINLEGVAITGVYLYNMVQNFGTIESIREDIFELSLNLQNVILKSELLPFSCEGKISKQGPAIITAEDIKLPPEVKIVNPHHYICCLNENCSLDMVLDIRSGRGYNILDAQTQKSIEKTREDFFKSKNNSGNELTVYSKFADYNNPIQSKSDLDYMKVDSIFTPIESFTFQVEIETTPDLELNSNQPLMEENEYLHVYLTTNGSISPHEALMKGADELKNLLYPLENITTSFNDFLTLKNDIEIKSEANEILNKEFSKTKEKNNTQINLDNKDFLNYPIEKLNLSKRIINSLKRANYNKINDLVQTPVSTFKTMKNFGKKSFFELKEALNELGIWLEIDDTI